MAIDFPASPTLNQEYSYEGRTWLWNGTGWEVKAFVAPAGATGATGVAGATGVQGATGVIGVSGATGATGVVGVSGATGVAGPTGATGATGVVGVSGATGVVGVSGATGVRSGVRYAFSTTVTDADPGNGTLRYNNAAIASVTQIFIDNIDTNSTSQTAWFATWDDSTNTSKGYVLIQSALSTSNSSNLFLVTAVTAATGYYKITVTYVSGSLPANAEALAVSFGRTGDVGVTGATGVVGVTGATGVAGPTGATGVIGVSGATGPAGPNELAAGTATGPSLYFTGDDNTGLYSPGADQLALTTGGVERVEFGTSEVVFNDGGVDVDFRVEGDTNPNLFKIDAGTDQVQVANLNGGPLAGMRNAIINGSFALAQRGTSFIAAANNDDSYNLDRWYVLSDGNDIVDITQNTATVPTNGKYAIALDVETVNKKFGIAQIIEADSCVGLIGDQVTLSFKARVSSTTNLDNVKAAIVAWSGTADTVTSDIVSAWNVEGTNPTLVANATYENTPANLNLTTSYATYSVTATVDTASAKNIVVFIWSDVTTTSLAEFLYITDVQLEPGTRATPFERRPIGTELALCQRYYYTLSGTPASRTENGAASTRTIYTTVYFPTTMRAAGTATATGDINNGASFTTWDVLIPTQRSCLIGKAGVPTLNFLDVNELTVDSEL